MMEIKLKDDFDKLLERSKETPIIVLKHSTRCPISSRAKMEVERFLHHFPEYETSTYLVLVIESRALSNYIEEKSGVTHQSPQILIIRNGEVISHLSHFSITEEKLKELLLGDLS